MFIYINCLSENYQIGFQLPATEFMEGIINLHHHIFAFLVLILLFVGWLLFRTIFLFHHSKNSKPFLFNHSVSLETVWTLIPCFILAFIAIPSFALIYRLDELVEPSITYKVIGKQWYWTYEMTNILEDNPRVNNSFSFDSYMRPVEDLSEDPNSVGQFRLLSVDHDLVVPVRTPIRLVVTGNDVIHSWAVPALGVKMDAIPGRLNQVNLTIKYEGVFFGQCSELCGVNHGFMPIVVTALKMEDVKLLYAGMKVFNNVVIIEDPIERLIFHFYAKVL